MDVRRDRNIQIIKIHLTLDQVMKVQRGSRGTAVLFNLNTRCGRVVNVTRRPLCPRARDPVHILQEAGWAPEPVWVGAENLAPTRL
jgi:hypothetical protein